MNKVKRYLFFVFIIIGYAATAQDIHFSQYYNSILNLNSSQTGFIADGDYRFAGNFKNQWQSIPVPYNSTSLSAEKKICLNNLENDFMGAGVLMNYDQTGDSRFKTLQLYLNAAYHKCLDKDSTFYISFGLQPGLTNKSLNYNRLTFDNQYRGDSFDPSYSNGESLPLQQLTYFDFGSGINLYKKFTSRNILSFGFSANHLNYPRQSFFDNAGIKLDRKFTGNIQYGFKVQHRIDLITNLLYAQQGKYKEFIPGVRAKFLLNPINGYSTAFYAGLLLRGRDALIGTAGMDYYNFHVALSYDANFSGLIPASNYRGGFELSIIYIIKKIHPFVAKKRVCPIYM